VCALVCVYVSVCVCVCVCVCVNYFVSRLFNILLRTLRQTSELQSPIIYSCITSHSIVHFIISRQPFVFLSHLLFLYLTLPLSVPLSGPQAPSTPSTTAPKESVANLSTPTPVPLGGQNGAAANHAPGMSPSCGLLYDCPYRIRVRL
jgi:hypothetical protein